MNIINHFKTITYHKLLVMKYCFKVGLYKQGLLHDLSKYSFIEFSAGIKYYRGYVSPNGVQKTVEGYSSAWLHHKGRNRHHFEYWIDYSANEAEGLMGMKMPIKYVVEMFIDRVCASKNYLKENYTDKSSLNYYENRKHYYVLHNDVRNLLETLLNKLANEGEDKTFTYIKNDILKNTKS
ncbi:DUF5662 family protein [Clostridium saccharoperbutylacetonicum]